VDGSRIACPCREPEGGEVIMGVRPRVPLLYPHALPVSRNSAVDRCQASAGMLQSSSLTR
jgi:hypothetical protein